MANIPKAILDLLDNAKTAKFAKSMKHADLPANWADDPEIVDLAAKAWQEAGTDSPFFKAWAEGAQTPRLFHGTEHSGFSEFSKDFLGDATNAPSAREAFFFTNSPENANYYTLADIFPLRHEDKLPHLFSPNYDVEVDKASRWKDFLESFGKKKADLSRDSMTLNSFFDTLNTQYPPEFDNILLNGKGISWHDLVGEEMRNIAPTTYKYGGMNAPKVYGSYRYLAENGGGKNIDELKAAFDEFKAVGGVDGLKKLFANTDIDFAGIEDALARYKKGIADYDKDFMDYISYMDALKKKNGNSYIDDVVDISEEKSGNPGVYPVFFKEKNPLIHDYDGDTWRDESFYNLLMKAKKDGNDSAVFKNVFDPFLGDMHTVFEPTQIKSIFNRGTFNPADPNIMRTLAPLGVGTAAMAAALLGDGSEAEAGTAQKVMHYMMRHRPDTIEDSAALHDLADWLPGIYDSAKRKGFSANVSGVNDADAFKVFDAVRGNPDALVDVFRAVPKGKRDFNAGDWVSISKDYAHKQGKHTRGDDYDIITTKARAGDISEPGDSIFEQGYWGAPVKGTKTRGILPLGAGTAALAASLLAGGDEAKAAETSDAQNSGISANLFRSLGIGARDALEGLGEGVGFVANPFANLLNAAAGGSPTYFSDANAGRAIADLFNLPLPESELERIASGVTQGAAEILPMMGAGVAMNAAKTLPVIAKDLLASPKMQMAFGGGLGGLGAALE